MTMAIIVQARMTSTRLPGKILAPIEVPGHPTRPMMAYQLERLRHCRHADAFVIATTREPTDDPVAQLAEAMGWTVVRGSEDDVLDRFWQATRAVDADLIVRITADCPLIEPAVVDEAITFFRASDADYVAPVGLADGMNFEVLNRRALETAAWEARAREEREHVTMYVIRHPERFRLRGYEVRPDLTGRRWTVDTQADLDLIRLLFAELVPRHGPRFTTAEIVAVLAEHPDWENINAAVQQRNPKISSGLREWIEIAPVNPWLAR